MPTGEDGTVLVTGAAAPGRRESGRERALLLRGGPCGTCETRIVAGTADHRGSVLTEEERRERGSVMICVPRAERGCAELTPGR
ncbi:hypothetical protein HNR06_000637 [Nocardiopsis arvandica]|uniref:2Fe-2S ferredoxin-type domain-containing protein n=1 Tax=Nocardiopsis sinuspersici TaxID=501010 RepID=A0A7Z0BGZ2_9ACTN|nr:hypothetical protein [Nocardiopsis sinuspersici]